MGNKNNDNLDGAFPRVIKKTVRFMQRVQDDQGNDDVKHWTENVITIETGLGVLRDIMPLCFVLFPDLFAILVGEKPGNTDQKLSETLDKDFSRIYRDHLDKAIELLSITLEKPVKWFDHINAVDGGILLSDWLTANIHMFTDKGLSDSDTTPKSKKKDSKKKPPVGGA